MNPILKNILAVLAGCILGMIVNGGLITISPNIIPPPDGVDFTTSEGLKSSMHLMEPKHFIMPFLAHALGTFCGAVLAAFLAASHKMKIALLIGVFFLIGGVASVVMLPSPLWFNVTDLLLAYIPMGWLAGKWINRSNT